MALNIAYVTNARIPTEKAHGLQIMKMCEAFASTGCNVELVVPQKKNFVQEDAFGYYGVPKIFSIKKMFSLDVGGRTKHFATPLFFIDMFVFLLSARCSLAVKNADVVYTRDYLLPFFLSRKIRTVVEIHSIPRRTTFFVHALKRASKVVVITHGIKDRLVACGIPVEKIIVAPDAVDLKLFDVDVSRDDVRKKLGLDLRKHVAMYIGLFDEWKGYMTLLRASEILHKEGVDVVVIGGTEMQVKRLRELYPQVIFLGFRNHIELPQNQKAADVLVIPNSAKYSISKYFTSPLKLFAHMVSGVPIVASDLPSLREILHEDNATFVAPDDPQALAEGILVSLFHQHESRKKAARARVDVEDFTWEKRAQNIIRFLQCL